MPYSKRRKFTSGWKLHNTFVIWQNKLVYTRIVIYDTPAIWKNKLTIVYSRIVIYNTSSV